MEVVVTAGLLELLGRAKFQSNRHHQQTNIQFFTGLMPFLSPNQQCQSTEGKGNTNYTERSQMRDCVIATIKPLLTQTLPTIINKRKITLGKVTPHESVAQIIVVQRKILRISWT